MTTGLIAHTVNSRSTPFLEIHEQGVAYTPHTTSEFVSLWVFPIIQLSILIYVLFL